MRKNAGSSFQASYREVFVHKLCFINFAFRIFLKKCPGISTTVRPLCPVNYVGCCFLRKSSQVIVTAVSDQFKSVADGKGIFSIYIEIYFHLIETSDAAEIVLCYVWLSRMSGYAQKPPALQPFSTSPTLDKVWNYCIIWSRWLAPNQFHSALSSLSLNFKLERLAPLVSRDQLKESTG